jgi:hypothetical protein
MKKTVTSIEALARLMGDEDNADRASKPFGIAAQELDGQNEVLSRDILPRKLTPGRDAFEKAGFVFGKFVDGLFVHATLPEGWIKQATDDPVHTDILDRAGRRRGGIFYRAAFYNMDASTFLMRRYIVRSCDVEGDTERCELAVWDNVTGSAIQSVGFGSVRDHEELERLRTAAADWINERFPLHTDPTAYW